MKHPDGKQGARLLPYLSVAVEGAIARLEKLVAGLTAEMATWKNTAAPLLPGERDMYLENLQAAVIGLDDARDTLEDAVQRLEGEGRQGDLTAQPSPRPPAGTP